MSQLSNYAENALLNGTAMPATLYLQMHTGATGEDGTTNVSTHTGARPSFTRTTATTGTNSNAADVSFTSIAITPATEDISRVSVWDSATLGAGNCWWVEGTLAVTRTVADGDTLTFAAGDLDFTLA